MPSLDSKCGLSSKELESILQILTSCAALKRAQLFGSRAMNTHRPTSDVDLALFGSDLLRSDINKLKIAFEDSLLPYTFDLITHSEIKEPELLAHIQRRGVDLYREGFYLSDDGEWIPEGWKAFAISELLDFENKRRIPYLKLRSGKIEKVSIHITELQGFSIILMTSFLTVNTC